MQTSQTNLSEFEAPHLKLPEPQTKISEYKMQPPIMDSPNFVEKFSKYDCNNQSNNVEKGEEDEGIYVFDLPLSELIPLEMSRGISHQKFILPKQVPHYDIVKVSSKRDVSLEEIMISNGIRHQITLRLKYGSDNNPHKSQVTTPHEISKDKTDIFYEMKEGLFQIFDKNTQYYKNLIPDVTEFYNDLIQLFTFIKSGPAKTFTYKRINVLEKKFRLYETLNWDIEEKSIKDDEKDFYNVYKVDNHLHLAAAMTAAHLLTFIKKKAKDHGDDIVYSDNNKDITLSEVCNELPYHYSKFTIDNLSVWGSYQMFHRFDYFNQAYNPFGASKLRNIFLKTDNKIKGRYFAEISKEIFEKVKTQNYNILMEPRVSIYGRGSDEWDKMADWIVDFNMMSDSIRWIIQFPRIYPMFRRSNIVSSFSEYIYNLFQRLFEVSIHPNKYPKLNIFLKHVVAFDSVDDESPHDDIKPNEMKLPEEWNSDSQPPYSYYSYYIYANLRILNQIRSDRGLNIYAFRPHCGEAGPVHHLATAFLLSKSINHGIQLDLNPTIQYLYFLCQVGCSISPLSNNTLFRSISKNPFLRFFQMGMNVTLSTDDPMQFHTTQEPLMEEYTIAKQYWKLSTTDLSEIAMNSVLQSGFSHFDKIKFLGENYLLSGHAGNDVEKSNIPNCRAHFRHNNLIGEYAFITKASDSSEDGTEIVLKDEEVSWQDLIWEEFH